MASHVAVNLILGTAALLILLPVRAGNGRTRHLMFGLVLGLAAGVLIINVATSQADMSRDTEVRIFEKYAWQNADPSKTQLLLMGSSLTALGVDNDRIARDLKARGYPIQVLSLAKMGTAMIEQEDELDDYLARAKNVPEFVFFEIGPEYWADTAALGAGERYTANAIASHGVNRFAARAESIAAYPATPVQKFDKYSDLVTYTLFNVFDFGLSGQLVADAQVRGRNGFVIRYVRRHHATVTQAEVDKVMQPAQLPSTQETPPPNLHFVLAFRRMQIAELKARGVKVVGFFQPELPSPVLRGYGLQMCRDLPGIPCIIAEDPALRRKLHNRAMWYDGTHLLHAGAEVYSKWLSGKIAAALAPYMTGTAQ